MTSTKFSFASVPVLVATGVLSVSTGAQEAAGPPATGEPVVLEEVLVTGSRIRRPGADTSAPVTAVDQEIFDDRGYVSASQAINQLTSAVPQLNQAPGDGDPSGSGQQYPNLFGLGAGRTLSLVNGRRTVTTSSGIGDAQVDANIIPVGLLERVEVVQGGGAAVYGSDAIAGVVNYILKDDFEGVEIDVQGGNSSRDDYPVYNFRGTFGSNFDNDRGNVAFNVEWSEVDSLAGRDRPASRRSRVTQSNPADTGPNDGIPSVSEVLDATFWEFNPNGVIFFPPAPFPDALVQLDGSPLQFDPDGSVVPYDPGNILGVPFARGGEGFRYSDIVGLRSGVERLVANMIGHYDLSDQVTLSTELLYARTEGVDVPQGQSRTVLNATDSNFGPIFFNIANPFLTPGAIETLTAANPGFAAGAPMFLSKYFNDLVPSNEREHENETYRALLSLDGDTRAWNRDFYWSLSGSYGRVEGDTSNWVVLNENFNNAISAARDGSGEIVCAVNADDDPGNDAPGCAPINPFGDGNVGAAARDYVSALGGESYTNEQLDFIASLGGDVFDLPAGELRFSVAYEHRREEAEFNPKRPNRLGLFGVGEVTLPESGKYNTDEFAGELLVPIFGNDFTLPLVDLLELSTAYRYVDNSLAGTENVWDVGLRWIPVNGLTLRTSRSRNFRAPSLTQLLAPASTSLQAISVDPCDADRIDSGPNPAVRRANCEAEFAANPAWGDVDDFQDPAENFTRTEVTTQGNMQLENEVSDTFTYGLVFEPEFIPGLMFTVDRVEIDLEQGLSAFETEQFATECYDSPDRPEAFCSTFSRLPVGDGLNPGGTIVSGTTTTVNAGVIEYRGEVYRLIYDLSLSDVLGGGNYGGLTFGVEATHNSRFETAVTGSTFVRTDDTVDMPSWVARFNIDYDRGPLRVSYQADYLDETRAGADATIENNPNPVIDSNTIQSVSARYEFDRFTLRAGVNNFTDEEPSYPTMSYGDIIGRQYFVGLKMTL